MEKINIQLKLTNHQLRIVYVNSPAAEYEYINLFLSAMNSIVSVESSQILE